MASLQPSTEGYIAVILPKFEESKTITENLLSREEFESLVSKRSGPESQPSWQSSTANSKAAEVKLLLPTRRVKTEDIVMESVMSLFLTSKGLLHLMQAMHSASRLFHIVFFLSHFSCWGRFQSGMKFLSYCLFLTWQKNGGKHCKRCWKIVGKVGKVLSYFSIMSINTNNSDLRKNIYFLCHFY